MTETSEEVMTTQFVAQPYDYVASPPTEAATPQPYDYTATAPHEGTINFSLGRPYEYRDASLPIYEFGTDAHEYTATIPDHCTKELKLYEYDAEVPSAIITAKTVLKKQKPYRYSMMKAQEAPVPSVTKSPPGRKRKMSLPPRKISMVQPYDFVASQPIIERGTELLEYEAEPPTEIANPKQFLYEEASSADIVMGTKAAEYVATKPTIVKSSKGYDYVAEVPKEKEEVEYSDDEDSGGLSTFTRLSVDAPSIIDLKYGLDAQRKPKKENPMVGSFDLSQVPSPVPPVPPTSRRRRSPIVAPSAPVANPFQSPLSSTQEDPTNDPQNN